MAKWVLDEKYLKGLAPSAEGQKYEVFDLLFPGLHIRVSPQGRKTWSFIFSPPGSRKRVRVTLGTYPATSLTEARSKALKMRSLIESGTDPREQFKPRGKTVADIVEARLQLKVRSDVDPRTGKVFREGLKSAKETERRYRKNILPIVGDVPLSEFRITHLNSVVDPVFAERKYRLAGMLHSDLQALMNFGVTRGEIPYNPIAKAEMMGSLGQERERFLALEEIRLLWNGLPAALGQSKYVPQILKLCLITGQRVGEVSGIGKSEIDLSAKTWIIPKNRTKNGDEHTVPLTDMALEIIRDAIAAATGDWLFPANDGGPFERNAVTRAVGRAQQPSNDRPLGKFGIPDWTPHDLRRTVATHMSLEENGLNIPELHISYVLNHRSVTRKSITQRVYNRNRYLTEKRHALEKWATFLRKVVDFPVEITGSIQITSTPVEPSEKSMHSILE